MSLYSAIKGWIENEMIQVLNAPTAFVITIFLGVSIAYIAAKYRYGTIVKIQKATIGKYGAIIESQKVTIEELKTKTQNNKIKKEDESTEKRLHNLIPLEKKLLLQYITENTHTHEHSIFEPTVIRLIKADILYQTGKTKHTIEGMYDINITDWAFKYLHKHHELLEF